MQDNLSRAFTLLDDDNPKTSSYGISAGGSSNPYGAAPTSGGMGAGRLGTAPVMEGGGPSGGFGAGGGIGVGGGALRSNYTGSDFGDSE